MTTLDPQNDPTAVLAANAVTPGSDPLDETDPENLLDAVNALSRSTRELARRLDVAEKQQSRQRGLTRVVIAVIIAALVFVGYQVHNNHANSVQQCENSNSARTANLALWTFIFSVSGSNPDQTPNAKTNLQRIETWVQVLYQPHDCSQLDKVYKIPTPPKLLPNS